jgi:hypothetical protein
LVAPSIDNLSTELYSRFVDELITLREAAEVIDYSRQSLLAAAYKGDLEVVRVPSPGLPAGFIYMTTEQAVRAWRDAPRRKPGPARGTKRKPKPESS